MTFKYFTSSIERIELHQMFALLYFFINYRKIQLNQPTSMNFCLKNVTIIRMVWNVNKCVATAAITNCATTRTEVVQADVIIDHLEGCVNKVNE